MNQILALREKRANLWNQTKALHDTFSAEVGWPQGVFQCGLDILCAF